MHQKLLLPLLLLLYQEFFLLLHCFLEQRVQSLGKGWCQHVLRGKLCCNLCHGVTQMERNTLWRLPCSNGNFHEQQQRARFAITFHTS